MAKKGSAAPPPSPDPVAIAQAQSEANIATAREQQRLNMINTYGPTGSVVYGADPNAPGGYSQTTNLSPAEQATYDLSKQAENGALGVANTQLGRVSDALGQTLDLSKLPGLTTGVMPGTYVHSFDPGQPIVGQVGGDLNAARQQAIDASYRQATSRLDPRFSTDQANLETKLANEGLSRNSTAWGSAMDEFGRTKNDAYAQAQDAAVNQGETAAANLFSRQLGQGQFSNSAAAQQYAQNQGQAQFANQSEDQRIASAIAAGTFGNTARQQALQEQAFVQNQPINQFTALLGLGQVGTPQGIGYSPTQVGTTDVIGANALKTQADQAAYQAKAQQQSGLMSGLFQLGSAAILASDARLKTDVRRVGALRPGIGLYAFRYSDGGPEVVGVIAQEVGLTRPQAVVDDGGYLAVDYRRL